jgi:D-alanyl-D-alanine carboxypeptidase
LAKYAYGLPFFKEIIATEFYTIIGNKEDLSVEKTVRNTNYMMGEYNGAEYYYPYSLGGKTGNTGEAGRCLISFAKKGELELVAITLGVPNEHSNYHLNDHRKLF